MCKSIINTMVEIQYCINYKIILFFEGLSILSVIQVHISVAQQLLVGIRKISL